MLVFRPASPEDPDAQEILSAYFAMRAAEFPGGTYSPVAPSPSAFTEPVGVLLLAEHDGGVVGCGGIRLLEHLDGRVYEVKHVFLRPETRGRGWGRHLLEELERRARAWEATALVLDTHHTLASAGHLYLRTGFVEIPAYNDNPNATRWYRKDLVGDER
ncbi:GNAT family N-acetyltransferase [Microbacterium resistens]|uniref:GNAT family N-acetyltransferase n=1 Tax=Microbacterium resistens TaxID=156977 RepID=UPI001C59A47A|nr:GNAT family N-acetyltransferase [Microbacterium resistens]MBW1639157.1 GNAT family N-acetyltransferase [Microbacterium resistens]